MPIHHTFGPHVTGAFLRSAARLLLRPLSWRTGSETALLARALHTLFDGDVALFASGREGLVALLRALPVSPGDEVIVQGYTCVAVPNAIRAAGAVPVFVDIDPDTLNLDVGAAERAVTPRTKMLIAQHTFGIPAPTQRLRALCDRHGIFLLEDCAHVLPDDEGPADVAQYGDGLLLSFGRDKAVSGIAGGGIVCRDAAIGARLLEEGRHARPVPLGETVRLLLYPLLYAQAKLLWPVGLGRASLKLAHLLGLMPRIYTDEEKRGRMSPVVRAIPNACAALALGNLRTLRAMNAHRRALTARYLQASADRGWPVLRGIGTSAPLLKYPLFVERAALVRAALKKHDIHLDDGWTQCVVCPSSVNPADIGYREGCDPRAESAATAMLTLPTHPTMTDAQAATLIARLSPLLHP